MIDPQNTQLSSAKKILEGEYNLKKRGGPPCTIADMFLARIWGVFLICYISKGIVVIENIKRIVQCHSLTAYNIKHRKNCECCPGHYLSTSVY